MTAANIVVIDYVRVADADDSRFRVEIDGRIYKSVSHHSAYRLIHWIAQRVSWGGSNYRGGHFKVSRATLR